MIVMNKTNYFVKHLKNINNFINNLLEKNLNKLNFKNFSFLLKNNKIEIVNRKPIELIITK